MIQAVMMRGRERSGQGWLGAVLVGLCLMAAGSTTAQASFAPAPGSPLAVGAQPYAALAQDLNGDGRIDVAAMNGTSSNLSVFLGASAGGFVTASGSPFATGSGPSGVAVDDFNADNRPDFAVSNYVSGTVSLLLAQPGGGWAQEAGGAQGAQGAAAVATADVNGDARPDLLVPDYNAGGVSVLLRQAGGGFVLEGKPATGANPRALAVADFNADGRPDMAVTNIGSGTVSVLLRQPGGGFAPESGSPVPVGVSPSGIVARDLNGDGRPDLAVANNGSDNVSVLLRQASGGFAADPASPVAVGDAPVGIAAPDLNGDGRPDLAVTNNAAGTLSVLLRQAGGGFAADAGSPIGLPAGPAGVASADVDGDGRPDLAVTSDQANVLSVLLNRIPAPGSPTPVAGPGAAGLVAATRPPAVVGVAASEMAVAGGGGKASPSLERALKKADLEARLNSAPASSRVTQQVSEQQSRANPEVAQRLDSLVYGIPVTVTGSAGEVVDVAAAVAVASCSGTGTRTAVIQLPPAAVVLHGPKTVVRLPVDQRAAAEMQRACVDEAAIAVTAKALSDELDSLSEMGEMESLRLQMAMDRMSKMMSMLSNTLQKMGEASSAIVGNLKRPSGTPTVSRAALRRQAGTAASRANAAGHEAAALLAPVLRAHATPSPRATFALKPCPKRCTYPRFAR